MLSHTTVRVPWSLSFFKKFSRLELGGTKQQAESVILLSIFRGADVQFAWAGLPIHGPLTMSLDNTDVS